MADGPKRDHRHAHDLLDEWRDAEHDAEKAKPGSAARKMARKRADAAREHFHEAEDEEREIQGNHRPRQEGQPESEDAESTG